PTTTPTTPPAATPTISTPPNPGPSTFRSRSSPGSPALLVEVRWSPLPGSRYARGTHRRPPARARVTARFLGPRPFLGHAGSQYEVLPQRMPLKLRRHQQRGQFGVRSEEPTSELQSRAKPVCEL